MTESEIVIDLVRRLARGVRATIAGLSQEVLDWQPDPEANSIGVTVWHFSRWIDFINVRALEGRPAADELWFTSGWAAETGYDPRGLGYGGLGALTGYTMSEVRAVPALSADALLRYLDRACDALIASLEALPPDALHRTAPGLRDLDARQRTAYQWIIAPLLGCFGHLGEIEALKALQARAGRHGAIGAGAVA
ncbi:MAG: DinB family protein [Thermomicrobiales bacterium]